MIVGEYGTVSVLLATADLRGVDMRMFSKHTVVDCPASSCE